MSLTISDPFLENTIQAAIEIGAYPDIHHLISDSLHALIDKRGEFAIDIACHMYRKGAISLGRACELANIDLETMKAEMKRRQIPRTSDLSSQELEDAIQREFHRFQQQPTHRDLPEGSDS